jgi:hypothetical protein
MLRTLDFCCCLCFHRNRVPPKSLLQLVDNPSRAERMVLLKPLSSVISLSKSPAVSCTRATMASGIATQQVNAVEQWIKPFGSPPSPVPPLTPKPRDTSIVSKLRSIRNRTRSLRRHLPKSKEGWIFLAYFTFIFVYAICDFVHYTWVLFTTALSIRAH